MTEQNTMFTEVKEEKTPESITSYKEHLVGDDKKFKDEEALARGKYESDLMIEQLLSEKRELEEKVSSSMTVEDLMAKLEEQKTSSSTETPQAKPEQAESEEQSQGLSEAGIQKLLDDRLNEFVSSNEKKSNLTSVQNILADTYGKDATALLNQKSRELNVSMSEMERIAESNPKMFLSLVGVDTSTQRTNSTSPTPVDTVKMPSNPSGVKNYKYYEKMRKENPSSYFNATVQMEMFNQAKEQGDNFYK